MMAGYGERNATLPKRLAFWPVYLTLQSGHRQKRGRAAGSDVLLTKVLRDGFTTVPGYASAAEVAGYRQALPSLDRYQESSEGTRTKFVPAAVDIAGLRPYFEDPLIERMARAVIGSDAYQLRTIAQHRDELGRTGGFDQFFHSDSWRPRFKAFLYLTDVDTDHGPLVYLPRSHYGVWRWSMDWEVFRTFAAGGDGYIHDQSSAFTGCLWPHQADALAQKLGRGPVELTGTAGTLILWDARGFHRIKEISEGTRDILNSYWIGRGRHT